MDEIEITILKWEKYQKRKDVENPWWFAVSNELWRSAEFSLFTSDEKVVWYALLALASKQKSSRLKFNPHWFAANCHVNVTAVFTALEKIQQNQWATGFRTDSVQNFPATEQNRTLQNRTIKKYRVSSELADASPRIIDAPIENLILNLSPEASERIERIYPDKEFVNREVEKMKIWLQANSQKTPKSRAGWTRFVMGWLERGWERHRKNIQSVKVQTGEEINWDRVFGKGKNESAVISKADGKT